MKKIFLSLLIITLLFVPAFAQDDNNNMPTIGSQAPVFTTESTNGTVTFPDDYGIKWKILFSHQKDFTPVSLSELLELANMQIEFNKLGAQIAIISTDDVATHKKWKAELEKLVYKGRATPKINFPILDGHKVSVSKAYGMFQGTSSNKQDIRGVFIIDPLNVIRSINFYPMQVGLNMKEIERILVALQTSDKEMVCTPANWKNGEDVIVSYYPFRKNELIDYPELKENYYTLGSFMWLRKENKFLEDNIEFNLNLTEKKDSAK